MNIMADSDTTLENSREEAIDTPRCWSGPVRTAAGGGCCNGYTVAVVVVVGAARAKLERAAQWSLPQQKSPGQLLRGVRIGRRPR